MATGFYNTGVRSPRSGHTIKTLSHIKSQGWRNGDTGTEISEEEGETHLQNLLQNKADKDLKKYARHVHGKKIRSRGRDYIPGDQVVFRRIHGHIVPFRKESHIGF